MGKPGTSDFQLGYFGASTGAGAALVAAVSDAGVISRHRIAWWET